MPLGLVGFDKRHIGAADCLIGIDEAGRGCLAGPVVAAAVRCRKAFYHTSWCSRNSRMVDDSKRLSAAQRAAVVTRFRYALEQDWIRLGIGIATIDEIERYNVYHANSLAMRRALEQVADIEEAPLWEETAEQADPVRILIDGKPIRTFPNRHAAIVKGDQKSLAIALAGIHAKQHRDNLMDQLDRDYPEYRFAQHKGYGTEMHVAALKNLGPCPHHRLSFLCKALGNPEVKLNHRQDSLF